MLGSGLLQMAVVVRALQALVRAAEGRNRTWEVLGAAAAPLLMTFLCKQR